MTAPKPSVWPLFRKIILSEVYNEDSEAEGIRTLFSVKESGGHLWLSTSEVVTVIYGARTSRYRVDPDYHPYGIDRPHSAFSPRMLRLPRRIVDGEPVGVPESLIELASTAQRDTLYLSLHRAYIHLVRCDGDEK